MATQHASAADICTEVENGEYCGWINDDQWQRDVITLLCNLNGSTGADCGLRVAAETADGVTDTFTHPDITQAKMVFVNGQLVSAGAGYSGGSVIFSSGNIPQPGDRVEIFGML